MSSKLPDETDSEHYFNAAVRLTAEYDELRAEIERLRAFVERVAQAYSTDEWIAAESRSLLARHKK